MQHCQIMEPIPQWHLLTGDRILREFPGIWHTLVTSSLSKKLLTFSAIPLLSSTPRFTSDERLMPNNLRNALFPPGERVSLNFSFVFFFDIGVILLNKDFEIFKGIFTCSSTSCEGADFFSATTAEVFSHRRLARRAVSDCLFLSNRFKVAGSCFSFLLLFSLFPLSVSFILSILIFQFRIDGSRILCSLSFFAFSLLIAIFQLHVFFLTFVNTGPI